MFIRFRKGLLAFLLVALVFALVGCEDKPIEEEKEQVYKITYVLNGGTLLGANKFTKEDLPLTLPTPTKEGYEFGGWFFEDNFVGVPVTQLTEPEDVTLYAKWNEPTDPFKDMTDREVVNYVIAFLDENLPRKVLGDFIIPTINDSRVEIEVEPRSSTIENGVWKYNYPLNDYKEILDIKVKYGNYQTSYSHVIEVYGISDFDKFALADAELQEWYDEIGTNVTNDLELPKSAANISLKWATDNKEVLTASGRYIRPNDDTTVHLTAMMSSGDVNYSKVFTFNVVGFTKEEKIEYFLNVDVAHLVNGQSSVDVTLPSNISRFNFQIEWKSSNPDVLGHDGEFKNPDVDTPIKLIATVRYRMTLVDPSDPSKGYKPLGPTSFEEVVEIPFTVKALETELDRAAFSASKNEATQIPRHFYYGKESDNKMKNLPSTIAGYEGFTITYASKTGEFKYDADSNTLELLVQPLLYKQVNITMIVSDGENTKEIEIPVNIGFLEKDQIGISPVSDVTKWLDLEKYNATNGFGNPFDNGKNIPTRDFTWNGLVFKSRFKWYHSDPTQNENATYTETDFFYFFRHNSVITIKASDLEEVTEDGVTYYTSKVLSTKHSGSYLKVMHNNTDKDVVVKGNELKAKFGFQQHNLYQLYIYDSEGNRTLAAPGVDLEAKYVIPAGGYIIERGYIDNAATVAFFDQAEKVEIITLKRHPQYGG